MRSTTKNLGGFVCGTTAGGLLVGLGEGLFRSAGIAYSALLYGTIWAIAGCGLAVFWGVVSRSRAVPRKQIGWGLLFAIAPSAVILVRFVIFRDFYQEAPGSGLKALAGGLLAAAVLSGLVVVVCRWLRNRFAVDRLFTVRGWFVPVAIVSIFAVRTQLGGDDGLQSKPPSARPLVGKGVVLIVFDALRADALGLYGAPPHRDRPASPNFDRIAQEARVFDDVSAQASWTRPAVASLLTSRHVSGHNTMSKVAVLPSSLPTVASVLRDAHIRTAAVVTNYNLERGYGFDNGFEIYRYLPPARYLGAPPRANRLAAYNVYRQLREQLFKSTRTPEFFYRSGHQVNATGLEILDQIGNESFFLYLHYMEPHDPFFDKDAKSWARVSDPHPPATWAPQMLAAYKDEVHRADDALAELLAGLPARGLMDRTTVIVTADHGEEFADHGGFYHGVTLYQELLHLPLIMAGPTISPGREDRLARQIDIAPTILSFFGVTPPPSWEGQNILSDQFQPTPAVAEEDHEGNVLKSLRVANQKIILANPGNPRGLPETALFDLAMDPGEQTNIQDVPETVAKMRAELQERLAAAQKGGAAAGTRELDADSEAQLRALGYIE